MRRGSLRGGGVIVGVVIGRDSVVIGRDSVVIGRGSVIVGRDSDVLEGERS